MALDSLQKRRAAAGAGRTILRVVHPVASPNVSWRMNVGHAYPVAEIGDQFTEELLMIAPGHMTGGFNRINAGFAT